MIRRILYTPPQWFVDHTTVEDRRMFGFWTLVISVILAPIFGRNVLFVTVLSIFALIPNVSSETPVEVENGS